MSNMTDGESFSSENNNTVLGDQEVQQQCYPQQPLLQPVKKKRNLPGTPDPSAEVIALSPTTLMATNRFVCEICDKGFQRDQNLQLHRRGHNLPWKLRQRPATEIRKLVYICPEPSCVHHNPGRALGDLTGIKKHFCRKHGEKKWNCDKCSKKYAVQSDWKAHAKTCGMKEYKCDCGAIFSRRDSFITHCAFCDALAEESKQNNASSMLNTLVTLPDLMIPTNTDDASISISDFNHDHPVNSSQTDLKNPLMKSLPMAGAMISSPSSRSMFSLGHNSVSVGSTSFENGGLLSAAHMSATALLQKAAQMGASASGNTNIQAHMERGYMNSYLNEGQLFNSGLMSSSKTVDFMGVTGVRRRFQHQQMSDDNSVSSYSHGEMEDSMWGSV